ncbi:MAG: PEP-CTERM sorting domain-containing protein [Okeania sp. SIO2C9]|uniref:XDD3 family exosortase-dependent surface protein n=1 Tax=Okeania sp. SIO2C9 TaxID=2607791 RepID=UPI0013C00254|nr:XDD3 family exosortase-dependent surface protein [Okeania sp. SIO2C9]NEQ75452.1 PEP-CTERM sorting domain-containing protein [Okeania sp. SIO2C9]
MKKVYTTTTSFAIAALLLNGAGQSAQGIGLTSGMFSLFLECNNDGTALFLDSQNGWQYSQDAIGDMTDGSTYDITGMGVFQSGNEVFVAIGSNLPGTGAGYDRKVDPIFHGDLFFTPGGDNFQDSMESGNLYGIHFSGSSDSGAHAGLGVYQNVAAKGVGMNNFGHRTYNNYAAMVDSSSSNFYGDLGVNNSYFNGDGTGYNVISGGKKVEDDGFEMLTLDDLTAVGLDRNTVRGSEILGFKFNLDAIVPPEPAPLPKDIGTLKGIAEGYDFDWGSQGWDGELAAYDTNIAEQQEQANTYQGQANTYQAQANAHQTQADIYDTRSQTASEEAEKLKQERNDRNSELWRAARYSPGGEANNVVKRERNDRNKILKQIDEVNEIIDEIPGQIADAIDERDALTTRLNEVPSEAEAIAIARRNPNGNIEQAYEAVAELAPKKEAWEVYKQENNWDNLELPQQLAVQEAYGGDWIELRGDGSPAKQEQELTLFSQVLADFESEVEQDRQAEIQQYQTQINQKQNNIDDLLTELNDAEALKPQLENNLENFYTTNDLRDQLEAVKANAEQERAAIDTDNSLNDTQKEELRAFYETDIARTQALINEIDNSQESLDTLFDGADQYFKNVLRADAKNSDSPIFDDNGNQEVYGPDEVTVQVPVYDEETGEFDGYETKVLAEERAPMVVEGAPKTVASEYARLSAESRLFNNARKDRIQEQENNEIARDNELAAKEEDINSRNQALNNRNNSLAQQQEQINLRDELLLEIETQIAQVRDEAIAQERREQMSESLAAAEVENQKEQELEERYGARTIDNPGGIPTSPEEVMAAQGVIPGEEVIAMDVPEPSSVLGLIAAIGSGFAALRRHRQD